jgi:hypothetical protein
MTVDNGQTSSFEVGQVTNNHSPQSSSMLLKVTHDLGVGQIVLMWWHSRFLWEQQWTIRVQKMWGIRWLAQTLRASEEGICSIEFVTKQKANTCDCLFLLITSFYKMAVREPLRIKCAEIWENEHLTLKVNEVLKMNRENFLDNCGSTLQLFTVSHLAQCFHICVISWW